jgi:hypothetical protein
MTKPKPLPEVVGHHVWYSVTVAFVSHNIESRAVRVVFDAVNELSSDMYVEIEAAAKGDRYRNQYPDPNHPNLDKFLSRLGPQ